VSELKQQSKHSRQLTSSASFLATIQATTEPHTLFPQREKGSRLRPAEEKHNLENITCTSEHHRNTQTWIQLSQSNSRRSRGSCNLVGPSPCCDRQTQEKQTATRDSPRCWKEKKTIHTENIPSTHCATMLNNLGLRRQHHNQRVTAPKTPQTHIAHTVAVECAPTLVQRDMRNGTWKQNAGIQL